MAKKGAHIFADKKIKISQNANLLLGLKITDNDLIYDLSLLNSMKQIQNYIQENF